MGIAGAQGSGKSTLAAALKTRMDARGTGCALLSIDDLYRTQVERRALAATVHPLLRTRGVPGTHDIALGLSVIAALERGDPEALPRFDKATDDRLPQRLWPRAPACVRLLILEGWCLGAAPQDDAALAVPVNGLEAAEDADGRWRRFVNGALAGDYQRLFARVDRTVLLAAPDFATVRVWRAEQEQALRARSGGAGMTDSELTRFIAHYERLTRHMLAEMPDRADLLIRLAPDRSVTAMVPPYPCPPSS